MKIPFKYVDYRDFCDVFCNGRQLDIVHKWLVQEGSNDSEPDLWHICTMDSNGFYLSAFYTFDNAEWSFKYVGDVCPNWDSLKKGK